MTNKRIAQEYFRQNDPRISVWESLGIRWVLHHKDPSWKHNDPERYEQWNIEDLLPMTASAHIYIHHTGAHRSDESKEKMSKNHANFTGENNPNYGNHAIAGENHFMYGKHHSEETKKKMSDAKKEMYIGAGNPNYGKHESEETRRKISESRKGRHWYNNGTIQVNVYECPDGFVPGMLKKS